MPAENDEPKTEEVVEVRGNPRLLRPTKGPLSGFEYELAQLYRAWPRGRVRKDN